MHSPADPTLRWLAVALATAVLTGCASRRDGTPDNEPTLKALAGRQVDVRPDAPGSLARAADSDEQAIRAYQRFLAAAPKAPQRAEALRRLGDLEMENAERRVAEGRGAGGATDYRAAVQRYQEVLKAFPNAPDNDRVLYQLARAHEQGGELDAALATLDRLVAAHPDTRFQDEAQFRRGELLFTERKYPQAEKAYATVLSSATRTPFHERALYMQGWSQFKQGRLDEALGSFFGVLDAKLAGRDDSEPDLEKLPGLTRADRELVEDTFRVTSISLESLKGAETLAAFMNSDLRRAYDFRVHQQLAALYLKQDRTKDAADTLAQFARRQPLHAQAPQLQAQVIAIYQQAGFDSLALEAKKSYVASYGINGDFRRANPEGWERARPLVKTHLAELAQHHHASAQKTKSRADVQEAARWYRASLDSFPNDPEAAQNNFLLAELLTEDQRPAEAAVEYEKTAYSYAAHPRSADAGYAALLAHAAVAQAAPESERAALQRQGVDSALRFNKAFGNDERSAPVLANAADTLFKLGEVQPAADLAQQLLDRQPAAAPAQRRVAWLLLAHSAFDQGRFAPAERAYSEVLALTPERDTGRPAIVERLAASAYKQGEAARSAGQSREAVAHFQRVGTLAPQSAARAPALVDAAAALIALKDWDAAAPVLEDFRQRFPQHALAGDVTTKLALVYTEQGRWAQAAPEYERLAAAQTDPALARSALWTAAEMYDKAEARPAAAKAWERYVRQHPQPLEPAVQARWRLAAIARADKQAAKELAWVKDVQQADANGGAARTDRTRSLGALATLQLTEPLLDAYRKVPLTEPLAKQLKLKKARMEEVLKAYAGVAEYGTAEATTAATFHTAQLYADFGKALLASQRPKKLAKAELEQYNVMLEEQAYPFEEKALELHEANARRAIDGIFDEAVQASFGALRTLRPVRYGKTERSEGVIDAIQ
ncbi:hypothetical protein BurJ1DRAFT_1741 [Burkholderiales bacterium JOSHI_001]|nr:hypothetical protein BurJ1DRAFT_1741 [Burkholderiales bacterium JOSHI_001]